MGRYRKLLVAVDGSESSMNALRESFKLALNEKSWITVTSVAPPFEGDLEFVGTKNILESLRRPCEAALAEAQKMAQADGALIKTVCEEGPPHERIVDLAVAENADLIIMGRKGRTGFERALVGSVTARVIGHSERDVLVMPLRTAVGWNKILIATDGSRFSMTAAAKAISLAESYNGGLIIICVVDVPSEFYAEAPQAMEDLVKKAKSFVEGIRKQAEEAGIKAETFIAEAEAYQAIIDLAQRKKADIIVMGSHGRTGLRRLLMGSVAEKVIGHAGCPVLIVRS